MCCISVLTQSCLLPVSKQMVVGRAKGWSTWMFPTNSFPLIGFSQWRVFHSVSLPSAWHQKCSRDWAAGCGGCENQQLEEIPYCQPQNHSVPAIISFQFVNTTTVQICPRACLELKSTIAGFPKGFNFVVCIQYKHTVLPNVPNKYLATVKCYRPGNKRCNAKKQRSRDHFDQTCI